MSSNINKAKLGSGIYHKSARPMHVTKDAKGDYYLCDEGANPGDRRMSLCCWGFEEVEFDRGG